MFALRPTARLACHALAACLWSSWTFNLASMQCTRSADRRLLHDRTVIYIHSCYDLHTAAFCLPLAYLATRVTPTRTGVPRHACVPHRHLPAHCCCLRLRVHAISPPLLPYRLPASAILPTALPLYLPVHKYPSPSTTAATTDNAVNRVPAPAYPALAPRLLRIATCLPRTAACSRTARTARIAPRGCVPARRRMQRSAARTRRCGLRETRRRAHRLLVRGRRLNDI